MSATDSERASVGRSVVRVRGGVQGVGFRPFVHGLAAGLGLAGLVGNDTDGVFIEIEGPTSVIEQFLRQLSANAPPLARIDSVEVHATAVTGARGFAIVSSRRDSERVTPVSPDVATCDDCLLELSTPSDRRHRYPFINCTNCGPRYTIVTALPYDRAQTTMAGFTMCVDCDREYADPSDRRFHAQPNACPACGPQLSWCENTSGDVSARGDDALGSALDALRAGRIIAVQGVGGFHIACRADDERAVALLRTRKHRPEKPLAVMVRNVSVARQIATVSESEAALLQSAAHPIVLLSRRAEATIAPSIAPGHQTIGVMLAYSPLHHLLSDIGPLVMTSGNLADEPIVFTPEDAFARFSGLADGILFHNRPIHAPAEDSVMRVALGAELPIRRSRGYAPYPVMLPFAVPQVLAVGGELKATVCVTRESSAFLSPHIGDVGNLDTERAMTRTVVHLQRLFGVLPECVAADMNPAYRSSVWAARFAAERGLRFLRVQHHHAHVTSLMAEHGRAGDAPILGVAFDGTGYGSDGTIWGGEFLLADYHGFERVAHLAPTMLAGGDAAIRHPARVALAHLHSAGLAWSDALMPAQSMTIEARRVLHRQLTQGLQTTVTTSAGRLLDACASLCGVRQVVSYEGQAAIEFEALAMQATIELTGRYDMPLSSDGRPTMQLTLTDFWVRMLQDLAQGRDRRSIALDVHGALADGIVRVAERVRELRAINVVGLTGGVFQNVLLLTLTVRGLQAQGFTVLTHRNVPPNDGGLALGQAMIAAASAAAGASLTDGASRA